MTSVLYREDVAYIRQVSTAGTAPKQPITGQFMGWNEVPPRLKIVNALMCEQIQFRAIDWN